MTTWTDETFEGRMRFGLARTRVLFEAQSAFQKVTIVETEAFGRALLLDDMWMTAEGDEKSYHEMLVHPAMVTAPRIARVLIVGGGDGGTAREVLRHPEVERVDMVEIDGMVVDACKEHLPTIGSAWGDPRLHVTIDDGAKFVHDASPGSYDVILIDGADPVGPAAVLFGESFTAACARALAPQGVFAAQAGSPVVQRDEHLGLLRALRTSLPSALPYYGVVSIYPAGAWSWVWAPKAPRSFTDVVSERVARIEAESHIYNGQVHVAAFAQPNHIARELAP